MGKSKARLRKELAAKNTELEAIKSSLDSQLSPSGGWYNPNNQFGPETDPNFNTLYLPPYEFTYPELTALYQNPLVRKVIRLHMNDGTRNGLELTSTENTDAAQEVQEEMESRFNWVSLIRKMIGIRHNYGGGVLYADIEDGGKPEDPLNEGRVKRVNGFTPVERFYAQPVSQYPLIGSEKAGQPMHYKISIQGFMGALTFDCHESRLIRFPAFESDDVLSARERQRRRTWDVPTVQIIYDAIKRYSIGVQSQSQLFQRFVMDVFKVADMRKFTDLEKLRAYVREQMLLRNTMNAVILPEDGDLTQMSTPVTGIGEMTKDMRMDVSMSTDIPLSILYSNESGNLGGQTTSEDRKSWYSIVISNQNNQQTPIAREMVRLVSLERGKRWPIDDIQYKWKSPYDHTPMEQAELENKQSETDKNNVEMGFPESQIFEARFGSGEFSQATPDFDKEEYDEELEEMEISEEEQRAADLEMRKFEAQNNANNVNNQQQSQDDKEFRLKFE